MEQHPANRIRELREAKDWSVRELGEAAGVNFSILNRIERRSQPLDFTRARSIAAALNVKVSELLPDEDVELRADEQGKLILAELNDIPQTEVLGFLGAVRQMVGVVRQMAAQRSAGALGGSPRQVGQLAEAWNNWGEEGRERALKMLSLIGTGPD